MRICTVVARNRVPYARVLAESFTRHHPGGECVVLVLDAPDGRAAEEPFELVAPGALGLADLEQQRAAFDEHELARRLAPALVAHLLGRGRGPVLALAPDVEFHAAIRDIEDDLATRALSLLPRSATPPPADGRHPREQDVARLGAYDHGWIGVAAGDAGREVVKWWSSRATERDLDRRWLDVAPTRFEVALERDTGVGVAWWNLHERPLRRDGHGTWRAGDAVLRSFAFDGFDVEPPTS